MQQQDRLFPKGTKNYKWYFNLANTTAGRQLETEWILNLAAQAGVKPTDQHVDGRIATWDGKYFRIGNSYNPATSYPISERLVIEFFEELKQERADKPKYIEIRVADSWLSNGTLIGTLISTQGEAVNWYTVLAYKSGAAIVDSRDHSRKCGWIPGEQIDMIYRAMRQLRKSS